MRARADDRAHTHADRFMKLENIAIERLEPAPEMREGLSGCKQSTCNQTSSPGALRPVQGILLHPRSIPRRWPGDYMTLGYGPHTRAAHAVDASYVLTRESEPGMTARSRMNCLLRSDDNYHWPTTVIRQHKMVGIVFAHSFK
jgi:hypothetical protein